MGKLRPNRRPFQFYQEHSTIEEDNMSTSTQAKQKIIELNDLDLSQLAEIKKQLEEVTGEHKKFYVTFWYRVLTL